jgi:hypothetical protein
MLSVAETTEERESFAAAPVYSFLLESEALKGYDIASIIASEESLPVSSVTPDDVRGAFNRER